MDKVTLIFLLMAVGFAMITFLFWQVYELWTAIARVAEMLEKHDS